MVWKIRYLISSSLLYNRNCIDCKSLTKVHMNACLCFQPVTQMTVVVVKAFLDDHNLNETFPTLCIACKAEFAPDIMVLTAASSSSS